MGNIILDIGRLKKIVKSLYEIQKIWFEDFCSDIPKEEVFGDKTVSVHKVLHQIKIINGQLALIEEDDKE